MHSSCSPWRMSIPVGQTLTQRSQATQSPAPGEPGLPRGSPRAQSYPMTSVWSSVSADWRRPYGHTVVQSRSRKRAKLKYRMPVSVHCQGYASALGNSPKQPEIALGIFVFAEQCPRDRPRGIIHREQ